MRKLDVYNISRSSERSVLMKASKIISPSFYTFAICPSRIEYFLCTEDVSKIPIPVYGKQLLDVGVVESNYQIHSLAFLVSLRFSSLRNDLSVYEAKRVRQ